MRSPEARESSRRAVSALLLGFGLLAVLFTGLFPPFVNPNELSRFQTVYALVEQGSFAIDDATRVLGDHEDKAVSGGRTYSNKAPGLAIAAVPAYRLLRFFLPAPTSASAGALLPATRILTVSLLCVFALVRLSRRLMALPGAAAAPLILCAVALGTPYVFFSRTLFSHAWTAALLFLSWDLLSTAEERGITRRETALYALAGLLAGWAAVSEYTVAPVAVLLAIRSGAGRVSRPLGLFVFGLAVPLLLLGAYNAACFGSPFILSSAREADPSYQKLASSGLFGFGPPSPRVGLAYLFHPARGVLIFSPFLLWCVPGFLRWWRSRERRADFLLALSTTLVYFVVMTGYPNWHGGWSLGSRYLLPVLFFPAMAIGYALVTPLSRGLFAAAVVFSVAGHFLLTSSWPYFPDDLGWPAAWGSGWFLARGWVAPSLFPASTGGMIAALCVAALAFAVPLALSIRAALPLSPRPALAVFLGALALAVLLARPPEPSFGARIFRAAMLGAYSGRDPQREELKAAALTASTPAEMRRAQGLWRRYGPPAPE